MEHLDPGGFSLTALDHARDPRNCGPLLEHNGHVRITGPCGDTMEFWVMIKDGAVSRVAFTTDGCRSSIACGSMASCLAAGQPVEAVTVLQPQEILDALGGVPRKAEHCALLAAYTLKAACVDFIRRETDAPSRTDTASHPEENDCMRIAIPLADGKLALHFGHCEAFALVDIDPKENRIVGRNDVAAPPHQPGLLPPWLAERGATVILAGGMGQRAHALFAEQGIRVVVGAPPETPEKLVGEYLAGTLSVGENICDH